MALILPNTNTDELFQLMKAQMTTEHEQLFMGSYYLYLQYGPNNKSFVVDFDIVWRNVEYSRRDNAKRVLESNFRENKDYKICSLPERRELDRFKKAAPLLGGAAFSTVNKLGGSGQNKETILLTVDCFKSFCMFATTPKAKVIRDYYIKMEDIMLGYCKLHLFSFKTPILNENHL